MHDPALCVSWASSTLYLKDNKNDPIMLSVHSVFLKCCTAVKPYKYYICYIFCPLNSPHPLFLRCTAKNREWNIHLSSGAPHCFIFRVIVLWVFHSVGRLQELSFHIHKAKESNAKQKKLNSNIWNPYCSRKVNPFQHQSASLQLEWPACTKQAGKHAICSTDALLHLCFRPFRSFLNPRSRAAEFNSLLWPVVVSSVLQKIHGSLGTWTKRDK